MCGILGVRRSWQPDRDVADRALASLAWRGPDGSSMQEVGDWYLGVARLAITDAVSDQPIRCPVTGRYVLFNGAVTSADREWREAAGETATRNDAELALQRLRVGGPAALTETCGPYALAVVDPQSDVLWFARDPEGEKPLFVVTRGRQVVAFASSVAALRRLGLDVRLDEQNAARFLSYGFALDPELVRDGYSLHADLRGAHVARSSTGLCQVYGATPQEARSPASFEQRVEDAVARCATAEVPVGLCLSGGVDSSCMAAALSRRGRQLPAYQFCAIGAPAEERQRARSVAEVTGMELRPVDGGPEILDALSYLTRCTGLPQGDPSVLATHALAKAARADGVRVLLSGEGADDLWLGYRRQRAAAHLPSRGWRSLPAPALANGALARLWRALVAASPYDALMQVSPPGFARAVLEPGGLPSAELPGAGAGGTALARARHVDRAYYLRHDLLPKSDTALMAAGVEGRCPYLDPGCLAAPETTTADAREVLGKRALKRAFSRDLPAGILERRKLGFGIPLDRWMREQDALADLLADRRTLDRPHLKPGGVRQMLDGQRAGKLRVGHALYLVAAYEIYLRYLEGAA